MKVLEERVKQLERKVENDYCNGSTKEEWGNYLKNSDFCLRTILEDVAYGKKCIYEN